MGRQRIPSLPVRPRSLLAAGLDLAPIGLLALAAALHPARLPLLGCLVAGTLVAARSDPRRTAAWAATLPVAASLAWSLVPLPDSARNGSTCTSPLAPFAAYRVIEAAIALGAVAVLARWLGGGGKELGLRLPGRGSMALASLGFALSGPIGILVGPTLARPFFGEIAIASGALAAIVPALTFALANGVMEETVYRGSLRAWTARTTGAWPAVVAQAIVFGLAHTGPGFTGSPLPVAAAMTTGGLVAGLIVLRTGSLFVPFAIHVGLDIPLFYGNACRIT